MKTAYVAIAASSRKRLSPAIDAMKQVLQHYNIEAIIFIDRYSFTSEQDAAMMTLALKTIEHADLLIAEVSDQAIGVGVEVGYAAAKDKPILYLRHADSPYTAIVGGVATHTIAYTTEMELRTKLSHTIEQLIQKNSLKS